MSKVGSYIADKLVSWIIEIAILAVVATITISEVRETNAKTQELLTQTQGMLASISEFAGDRSEAAGAALDSVLEETQNIELEGKIDINTLGSKAKDMWDNRKQEEDLEED